VSDLVDEPTYDTMAVVAEDHSLGSAPIAR
jgi:hypothetical protein